MNRNIRTAFRQVVCLAALSLVGALTPAAARAQSTPKLVPKTGEKPTVKNPWSFEVSSQFENQEPGKPDEMETEFSISRQVTPKLALSAAVNQQDRFNNVDTQGIFGGSYAIPDRHMQVESHYTEGFGADQTSRHELGGKMSIALHKRIRPSFEYVHKWYIKGIREQSFTYATGVQVTQRLGLLGQLMIADSNIGKGGTAGLGGFGYGVNKHLTVSGGLGYGHEYFLAKTHREVRERALALAAQGGATIHLPDHRNLELQYQYQDRIDFYATHVFSASYTMSF